MTVRSFSLLACCIGAIFASVAYACPESEAAAKVFGANTKDGTPDEQWKKLSLVPGDATIGKAIYQKHCIICHGANGKADGELASQLRSKPKLFSDPELAKEEDVHLFYDVAMGVNATNMPPFYPALSVREIKHLVAYVRVLGRGGQVKAADYKSGFDKATYRVKRARQASVKRVSAKAKVKP